MGLAADRAAAAWIRPHGPLITPARSPRAATIVAPGTPIPDWTRSLRPWQAFLEPEGRVRAVADRLPEPGRTVLRLRQGWSGPPRTLVQVGEITGLGAVKAAGRAERDPRGVGPGAFRVGLSGAARYDGGMREIESVELIVGLEVHVELATQGRCCRAPARPRRVRRGRPNSLIDPTVLGLPGALAGDERRGGGDGDAGGLALGCSVAPLSRWDRILLLPDMPKGLPDRLRPAAVLRRAVDVPACDAGR